MASAHAPRRVATTLLLIGALGTGWVAWEAGTPPAATETLHLAAGQQAVLPAAHGDALLISGALPTGHAGEDHAGHYQITISDAESQAPLAHLSGDLEEHWEKRRAGRKGSVQQSVKHLEERYTLPSSARSRPLTIQVESESGDLSGPLQVSTVPRPPAVGSILAVGSLLSLVGTWTDRRQSWRTHLGVNLTMLSVFAAVLATALTPNADYHTVLGALLAAPFFGLPLGYLARFLSPE